MDVSSSFFRRRSVAPTGRLLSVSGFLFVRLHYDVFGSLKRNERAQTCHRRRNSSGGQRARAVPKHSHRLRDGCGEVQEARADVTGRMRSPSSSGRTRPMAMRHRSTANWRASATMAFLRVAPVVSGAPAARTLRQRCTPRYAGWNITTRQASWIIGRRSRGLPATTATPRRSAPRRETR